MEGVVYRSTVPWMNEIVLFTAVFMAVWRGESVEVATATFIDPFLSLFIAILFSSSIR